MVCSTIRQLLVEAEKKFGAEDSIRYKVGKKEIEKKAFTQLKEDSESFSRAMENLCEKGAHVAVTGMSSYLWIVTYF